MPDAGRGALHRVCDSVSGVNWRPTRFADELMLARYACSLCHVIPSTTVLLPCFHALCEQCQAGCVVEDEGSVCPLDGEPFYEDGVQRVQLPAKKHNLKAHCWNDAYGCDFVGPLAELLRHFEAECVFHTLPCKRCGENIPNAELAAHYIVGCVTNNVSSAILNESSVQGDAATSSSTTGNVTATGRGIEEPARNWNEEGIHWLLSQVNELADVARTQGAQQQEFSAALTVSLQTLNATVAAAAEQLSDAIGEVSQLHQRMLDSREEERYRAKEAEAAASASYSGVCLPRRKEATDILQNLEVLAAQSRWCLERLLRVHNETVYLPAAQSSMVSQSRGKHMFSLKKTCTRHCANANEIVYRVVISDVYELHKYCNATVTCRLRHRHAWCRVTYGILSEDVGQRWGLRLDWDNRCAVSSYLPQVVHVSEISVPSTPYCLPREEAECDAWTQVYCYDFNVKKVFERKLKFQIVLHDCE
ncbi:hypothetical protein HPB49_021523 [Dermacentor silvarum]|uniref:Uncharacterized protein n=1 Tax=Dermacentor silvarum TaxID=543639 RepID=A0ACB8DR51_DERSI|nr:uncharacterized protein LOC119431513 [Dermacentor silvarum]KAH7974930.1 hypothetical protein HPB49_021523 [Dermacentor silvarum]